jgi:hypothetical protein
MDHFSGIDQPHPLRRMAAAVSGLVKEVEDVDPVFMSPDDRAAVLAELAAVEDRLHLVRLAVMGASGDLAVDAGFRDVASWQQATQRRDGREARGDLQLADALADRWPATAAAVREGRVSLEQARRIVRALDRLADALATEAADTADTATGDTGASEAQSVDEWIADTLHRAEVELIRLAGDHTPLELDRLGERILGIVCPDHAEEVERHALERAERRASSRTRLTARDRGDGSHLVTSVLPDAAWFMLKGYLGALTSPRTAHAATVNGGSGPGRALVDPWLDPRTGRRVPYEQRLGQAFVALIERVTTTDLPDHGGLGASLLVTIDWHDLRDAVGHGTLGDTTGTRDAGGEGVPLSVGQVRRLACASGILPVVLGGESVPLDLGRTSRLFSSGQRKAHVVAHPVCEAMGCTIPAAWCEAHHKRDPWANGGTTNRADLAFLCPWHHHRAHDPTHRTTWSQDGARFHRRP